MDLARLAALVAVLATAVVYGTDVFCAIVQRPALARVDDQALVAVMGNVHLYGDRRLTAAATAGDVPTNARVLQGDWDRIITARAVLQGLAIVALCVALVS